jgi:hypothetical protein
METRFRRLFSSIWLVGDDAFGQLLNAIALKEAF